VLGACGDLVEGLLRALNRYRGEEYRYRADAVDEGEGEVTVVLRGRAAFIARDLDEIDRALAPCGARLADFQVEAEGDELLVTLLIKRAGRRNG
jgi:hypothetical protein